MRGALPSPPPTLTSNQSAATLTPIVGLTIPVATSVDLIVAASMRQVDQASGTAGLWLIPSGMDALVRLARPGASWMLLLFTQAASTLGAEAPRVII